MQYQMPMLGVGYVLHNFSPKKTASRSVVSLGCLYCLVIEGPKLKCYAVYASA